GHDQRAGGAGRDVEVIGQALGAEQSSSEARLAAVTPGEHELQIRNPGPRVDGADDDAPAVAVDGHDLEPPVARVADDVSGELADDSRDLLDRVAAGPELFADPASLVAHDADVVLG